MNKVAKGKFNFISDIIYILILLLITETFSFFLFRLKDIYLLLIGIFGLVLLEFWFGRAFYLYSSKKISKYSDVVMKISLKKRFFQYFVIPAIFYISILFFIYFNRNIYLGHTVIIVSISFLLILFMNVRSSLNQFYSVAYATKAIFDFICISTLFLLLNTYLRLGLSLFQYSTLSLISSAVLFLSILKLHDRLGILECLISLLSAVIVSASMIFVWNYNNPFITPAVGTLAFYLIVSFWNIRFSGKTRLSEYIYPLLYVIFALVLILLS